jgi:hypothetical protein
MASTAATNTNNLPIHLPTASSQNYETAAAKSQISAATEHARKTAVRIPDGRRNSQGEIIPSPTETWKPNFSRTQSWNPEDMKRQYYISELETNKKTQGGGFTEGGEGTRKV